MSGRGGAGNVHTTITPHERSSSSASDSLDDSSFISFRKLRFLSLSRTGNTKPRSKSLRKASFLIHPLVVLLHLKHTHRRHPQALVEEAQGTAADGKGLIPAIGHHPYQISLSWSNNIYSPVTPGGLTSR